MVNKGENQKTVAAKTKKTLPSKAINLDGFLGDLKRDAIMELIRISPEYSHASEERQVEIGKALIGAWNGMQPKNSMEIMIAAQTVAMHNATMAALARATSADYHNTQRDHLNAATKLSRCFIQLIDTMQRVRGEHAAIQKVIVEKVNVSEGGQAIVGNVAKGAPTNENNQG